MPDDALTVAKEITLAVLSKMPVSNEAETAGKKAGEVFRAVLKEVVEGIEKTRQTGPPKSKTISG